MKTQLTQGKKNYNSGRALVFDRQSLGLCGFLRRLWTHESGRWSPCYVLFFVFVNVMFCGTHMGLAAGLGCALFLFFCSRRLWAHGSGRWSPFAALSFLCDGDTLCFLSFFYQRKTQERTCCRKFVPECGDFRSNSPPTNLLQIAADIIESNTRNGDPTA